MTSGVSVVALRRTDIPELSEFLGGGDPVYAYRVAPEMLEWKYFDGPGGPAGDEGYSLIARSAGRIVGHVGMCHRRFVISGEDTPPVSAMHAVDWRGSDVYPGLGAALMLRALSTSQIQYGIGGTADAQAVLPRLGFVRRPSVPVFRKVMAPLHRLRASHAGLYRKWGGAGKDLAACLRTRAVPAPQLVELRPAPCFTEEIDGLQRMTAARIVTCLRDHKLLNYLLRCPLPGFSGWTLHVNQRLIGFAISAITPHGRVRHGKIVDCWLESAEPAHWGSAIAALTGRLRELDADDVTCLGTSPCLSAALLANGFARWCESAVFVRDKHRAFAQDLPFGFSMLDRDKAVL